MKILWLIPLTVDATFQFTSKNELARALTEQGHEIETVVAFCENNIPLDGFSHVDYFHTPNSSVTSKFGFHLRMLRAAWLNGTDAVIFGVQAAHLIPFAAFFGLRRKPPIFILDIRTVPVDIRPDWQSLVGDLRYRLAIRLADWFCDGITVITPMLGHTITPKLKRIRSKLGVWTSGVCLEHFDRSGPSMRSPLGLNHKKVLLYHGILSPNRGLQAAIQAVALLREEVPELVFLVVGEGGARPELENLAMELDLSDRILFTGKVPYSEIPKYIRTADVSILPFPNISWWAVSSPIKLMEYLAIGIPIVATDISAHSWVARKTGGVLLARDSKPQNLAASVAAALNNPHNEVPRKLLQDMFSWKRQARNLVEFIKSLCSGCENTVQKETT